MYFHEKNQEFNEDKYFPIGIKNSYSLYTNLALLLSDENPFVVKMLAMTMFLILSIKKNFQKEEVNDKQNKINTFISNLKNRSHSINDFDEELFNIMIDKAIQRIKN